MTKAHSSHILISEIEGKYEGRDKVCLHGVLVPFLFSFVALKLFSVLFSQGLVYLEEMFRRQVNSLHQSLRGPLVSSLSRLLSS